jgi:hypothetical protein
MNERIILKFDDEEVDLGRVEDFFTPPGAAEELAQNAGMGSIVQYVVESIMFDDTSNPAVLTLELRGR